MLLCFRWFLLPIVFLKKSFREDGNVILRFSFISVTAKDRKTQNISFFFQGLIAFKCLSRIDLCF